MRSLLLLLALLGVATARAAPGELDPSFGSNGLVRFDVQNSSDVSGGVFAQADGKLLVASGGAVLRLLPDGTLDQSFGVAGRALIQADFETSAVLEQADGHIAAAGSIGVDAMFDYQDLAVARLLADGRADPAFGANGTVRIEFPDPGAATSAHANAVVQQGDGKLVVAGSVAYMGWWDYGGFGYPDLMLARLDIAGALDRSFGTGGRVVLDGNPGVLRSLFEGRSELYGLATQGDGKLVAVGHVDAQLAMVRLTNQGTPDSSFGADGIVRVTLGPTGAEAVGMALAVQNDGRIVVGGRVRFSCDEDDPACEPVLDAFVARFNDDGSLDTTFASGGVATFDAGESETEIALGGLALEPTGAVVVGGQTGSGSIGRYSFVARLTPTGTLDRSFGNDGVTLIDIGRRSRALAADFAGLARAPSGIVVATTADYSTGLTGLVIARLAPGGGHPGVLGLVDVEFVADEGGDARFTVRRTGGTKGIVAVDYVTYAADPWFDGSPWADVGDFRVASGTLTWQDGDAADRRVLIPVVADLLVESSEVFGLALENPGAGAILAADDGIAWITDVNRDAGVLQFETAAVTTKEGLPGATVVVTRMGGSTGAVSVDYGSTSLSAEEGLDFSAVNGTLRWAHGDTTPKSIWISIYIDGRTEPDETLRVLLRPPSGGAALGGAAVAVVTIVDTPEPVPSPLPPGFTAIPPGGSASASISSGGGGASWLEVLWLALLAWRLSRARSRNPRRARAVGRSE